MIFRSGISFMIFHIKVWEEKPVPLFFTEDTKMLKNYTIHVEAEDVFTFYLKSDHTPEEIKARFATFPDLYAEDMEVEEIAPGILCVDTGIDMKYNFTVIFRDGEIFDVTPKGADYEWLDDIGSISDAIKKHLGDLAEAIRISTEPIGYGFSFGFRDDDAVSSSFSYYQSNMDEDTKKTLAAFISEFMCLEEEKYHEISEEELVEGINEIMK